MFLVAFCSLDLWYCIVSLTFMQVTALLLLQLPHLLYCHYSLAVQSIINFWFYVWMNKIKLFYELLCFLSYFLIILCYTFIGKQDGRYWKILLIGGAMHLQTCGSILVKVSNHMGTFVFKKRQHSDQGTSHDRVFNHTLLPILLSSIIDHWILIRS